jgi:hypothetical protein
MLRTRSVLAALLLASTACALLAQGQEEPDAVSPVVAKLDERVKRFLDAISAGHESDAFDDLLVGSRLLEQTEEIQTLVDKSKEIKDRYGPFQETEQIGARRIGKDLVLMKYLFKCESFPVIWYFAFYRDFRRASTATDNDWVVIAVRFDTQLDGLFD